MYTLIIHRENIMNCMEAIARLTLKRNIYRMSAFSFRSIDFETEYVNMDNMTGKMYRMHARIWFC